MLKCWKRQETRVPPTALSNFLDDFNRCLGSLSSGSGLPVSGGFADHPDHHDKDDHPCDSLVKTLDQPAQRPSESLQSFQRCSRWSGETLWPA